MVDRFVPCHRLFFALLPPPMLARRMIESAAMPGCRPMLPERVHMTLFILADLPRLDRTLVERLRLVGAAVRAAPVDVALDRLAASHRSVALRPARADRALVALHRELAALAAAAGIGGRPDHRFSPHVTLGYGRPAPGSGRVAPLGWIADELVLIHSHVGQTRHAALGRWPLAEAPDPQLPLF